MKKTRHTRWKQWRQALKDGKVAGSIWVGKSKGAHLQTQHQEVDDQKIGVAAGNQYGGLIVRAYPDKVEVTYYDAQDQPYRHETVGIAPSKESAA